MKRIITITLLIAAAFAFAEGKPLRFARFGPMMQDKDTIVYKVDDAGNLILDSQGNSVIDTSETRIVRELIANSQDTLYNIYHRLDSTCIRELDSLYACYCDSICMTLHDNRDIKMLIKRQKKEYRDSVIQNTPRILETFVLPDSLYYERILSWTHNQYNNNVTLVPIDTSYNYHFYDNPIFKDATDAIYLGVAGSAALPMNYFQREELDVAPFFNPYLPYSYTPETLRMYNTKTPYTELAYWGNPFMDKEKEESDLKLLCTQNITPEMNLTFEYQRYGASGMLQRERTDNRSYNIGVNYIGKKYELNAAFMGQSVKRFENGGIKDIFWVCDTTIDTKAIDVNLKSAENTLKRKTLFLTQSLAVPLNFFRKDKDSLSVGDGTVIYLGHSLEYSKYSKLYTDVIGDGSEDERAFYNNEFNIFNNASCDSLAVTRFENKFFATLQPFGADAIVSKLNVGAGYQLLRFYSFAFDQFVTGAKVKPSNGTYLYANADGTFRKYVAWDAFGKMTTTGYYAGDFKLAGNVRLSVYPIKEGIHLKGHFELNSHTPHPFEKQLMFNHHSWNNEFSRTVETRFEGSLTIPKFDMELFAGYSMVDGMVYYDAIAQARQSEESVHVFSAYLRKDFRLWKFHFDNKILYQMTSSDDVLPLPDLSLNLKYYIQFPIVKEVMEMQLGANGVAYSKYYIPAYMPDLGVFYNQRVQQWGNNPYVDAFVNIQWKRVSVFVKYTNALNGWPSSDYFSACNYIRPYKTVKFGIYWPFYAK